MWLSREQISHQETASVVTEDELKLMIEAGQEEGVLEQEERQMIFSIFQLGDTLTREIMVPRIEMLAIDINTHLNNALDALLDSGYSRVPVFEGRVDNVIGIFAVYYEIPISFPRRKKRMNCWLRCSAEGYIWRL